MAKINQQSALKPQDLFVLFALLSRGDATGNYVELACGRIAEYDHRQLKRPRARMAAPERAVRGMSLVPLYPSAPEATMRDEKLYAMLSLFDAIRVGQARKREAAKGLLEDYFK